MERRTGPRLVALVTLFALGLSGCGLLPKEELDEAPVLPPPVKSEKATYTVQRGSIAEQISLRARLAPAKQADLAYPIDGRLKAVYVRAGDQVEAGQLLAELYADEIAEQISRAEIYLAQQQLDLKDAQYRAQFTPGPLMESEIQRRELGVRSAQLELERLQRALAGSRLVAPWAGQVIAVGGRPGESLTAHLPVITLVDPSDLLIEADVDEQALGRLAIGQRTRLEFNGLPAGAMGELVEMPATGPAAAAGSEPKRVKVRLPAEHPPLQMGIVGRVQVVLQEKRDVLLLPKGGVRQFANRTYVLLKEPRQEIDVLLGIEGETEVEILRGLQEGDQVIGR